MGETKKSLPKKVGLIIVVILVVAMVVVTAGCAAPDEVQPAPATPELYDISPTMEAEPTPPWPTPAALDFPLPAPASSSSGKLAQVTLDFPLPPPAAVERTTETLEFPLPAPKTIEANTTLPDDSACITCHTDQAILEELAVEPEKVESLSEGEG